MSSIEKIERDYDHKVNDDHLGFRLELDKNYQDYLMDENRGKMISNRDTE